MQIESRMSLLTDRRQGTIGAITCAFVFVVLGCAFIPILGVQQDEALFAAAVYAPESAMGWLDIGPWRIPTMLMSYVGAGKAWLYAPIFRLFGASQWTLRLPMVIVGALTTLLFFLLLRRAAGDRVALAGAAMLATDPIFVLTTTLDWGPVGLQHLLVTSGVLLLARRQPYVFAAFVAFGLMLWDKAIASWILVALSCATAIGFHQQWRKYVQTKNLIAVLAASSPAHCHSSCSTLGTAGPRCTPARLRSQVGAPSCACF